MPEQPGEADDNGGNDRDLDLENEKLRRAEYLELSGEAVSLLDALQGKQEPCKKCIAKDEHQACNGNWRSEPENDSTTQFLEMVPEGHAEEIWIGGHGRHGRWARFLIEQGSRMRAFMATGKDYYDVLGVPRTASVDEIRGAWRTLVRQYHPDVSDEPDAEDRFNEVQEAYDVLSDDEKRANYDRYGHAGASGWGGARGASVDPGRYEDIFSEVFGSGGGSAGFGGFRPGAAARSVPRTGQDIRMDLSVTFVTAAQGGTEQVRLQDGTSFQVKIPPGIDDGGTLRLKGRGRPGTDGGEAGDLLLQVRVGKHPALRRLGRDLYMDVPVTIAEAALGTKVRVTLLEGSLELKVPPGTDSGCKLRVQEHGIEDSDGERGDFFAVIKVVAPETMSDHARDLLSQLEEELPDPRLDAPGVDSIEP